MGAATCVMTDWFIVGVVFVTQVRQVRGVIGQLWFERPVVVFSVAHGESLFVNDEIAL